MLLQTIRLGLLFETADTEELNYRAELRDAMLRAVGSSRFAIYHHVIRRKAEVASTPRSATPSRAISMPAGASGSTAASCMSTTCS
jgi:type IV secretory pathway VirB4 component